MQFSSWGRGMRHALAAVLAVSMVACGGGGSGDSATPGPDAGPSQAVTYAVAGSVTGLASGKSVTLTGAGQQVTVSASGAFTVANNLANGTAYAVAVATQPAGQYCNVGAGTGTVQGANITNISVVCAQVFNGGSGTLSATGGTVTTAAADVTAPASASIEAQEVSVTLVAPPAGLPPTLVPVGQAVDVAISKPASLNAPFLLTVRYDPNATGNEDELAVVHYNSNTSRYEPVTVLSQDRTAHSFTFEARTFSPFLVVSTLSNVIPASFSVPGFTPAENGWNIRNFGNPELASYYTPGGNCLGMSAYATWYFGQRSDKLSAKYSSAGTPNIAQLVAVRAHLAQSQYWAAKQFSYEQSLGSAATARLMRLYLSLFRQPLVMVMRDSANNGHAVVLYGYDANGFIFYDVNDVGQSQTLTFSGTNFGTYGSYSQFGFVAMPSLGRTEDFAALTTQAEAGFSTSNLISVTSPTANQSIAGHSVQLTGTLSGTLNADATMLALVKGVSQQVAVDTGAFSATLPISNGSNTIVLLAGTALNKQSNWYPNAATLIMSVNGTSPNTTFLATLTWDQDNSDVDLYVTEPAPSNETAWYGHMMTGKRMALDFDNTRGFGPEHVTLTTTGTLPGTVLPGLYKVRTHYYGNYGAGATVSGTVTILINEGMPGQRLVTRRFVLNGANSGNAAPGGTGTDWADIATVDLVNGTIN